MYLTRRQLIAGALGTGLASQVIPLTVTGTAGRCGADLGLAEMTHTASLVGIKVVQAPTAAGVAIDLDRGALATRGETFHVAASDPQRRRALEEWAAANERQGAAALEWHPGFGRYGAEQLNERHARRCGPRMDAAGWIGWMLVKVAVEAAMRSMPIAEGRYDGHKGAALVFATDRRLVQPLFIVDHRGGLLGLVE